MSGTSADGTDAALVRISGSGTSTRITQLAFDTYPYPAGLRKLVLDISVPGRGSVDLLCELNILIAHFFSDAVKKIARKARVKLSDIDLIGSHGQTVQHLPRPKRTFGKVVRSTLQIGDPSTIAKLTGIPTVGDFRVADMAVGGEGAPLVPSFDYLMFRSKTKNRILLNLGGIANFTALAKNCSVTQVQAFDTGPANMIIDALMMQLYRKKYDAGGRIALRGSIVPELLFDLLYRNFQPFTLVFLLFGFPAKLSVGQTLFCFIQFFLRIRQFLAVSRGGFCQARLELAGLLPKLVGTQRLKLRLKRVDALNYGTEALDFFLVGI